MLTVLSLKTSVYERHTDETKNWESVQNKALSESLNFLYFFTFACHFICIDVKFFVYNFIHAQSYFCKQKGDGKKAILRLMNKCSVKIQIRILGIN